jgi:hypothetical protein
MQLNFQNTAVGGFPFEVLRLMSTQGTHGAELGECLATARRIQPNNFASWTREWSHLADRVALEAEAALRKGHPITAGQAQLRASSYYRAAEFYLRFDQPDHQRTWERSRSCFQQAVECLSLPVEPISIPFEEAHLPGYFMSGGPGARPTLIAIGGYDSSAEEVCHWIGFAAAERGWHCLVVEGPGQRAALHLNPGLLMRPDYEVPLRAVVDYAVARREVDVARLALIGYSFGGYLAPRAAAFEPRLKACIANPLAVDIDAAWQSAWPPALRRLPPGVFDAAFLALSRRSEAMRWSYEHARWAMGIHAPHEFFSVFQPYSLHGLEDRFHLPLLLLFTEDEIALMKRPLVAQTLQYLERLSCPRTLHVFTREVGASAHCQMGGLSRAQAIIFDWLEEICQPQSRRSLEEQAGSPAPAPAQDAARLIQKYHGLDVASSVPKLALV